MQNSEIKYTKVLDATEHKLSIWGGQGNPACIEAFDRGVIGMMPASMFDLYNNINRLYFEKSREAAYRLFNDAAPIIMQIYAGTRLSQYFQKAYFVRKGAFKYAVMRKPDIIDSYKARICNELVEMAVDIEAHLDQYWL